ncbi:MAG: glucose dehydrogenase [Planctomycetaceae bacterium]|nr:glucose dehydrogenase [Planctomycetaceae bacterium]
MRFENKVALVTGAGRGIGKGCALELARGGAHVILNDRPGSSDLSETQREIEALGARATLLEADVFQQSGSEELVASALSAAGQIDILVSNPAWGKRCSFLEYRREDFERVIQGTLISGFAIGQQVARHMVARGGGGKMVFISSVQAEIPFALSIAYGAAKVALNHMTRTIAVELFSHRINVNAIEPGWIDTPGEHESFGDEAIQAEGQKLPWGRLGTPTDIGQAAAFLVSDEADYITGSILAVDGGFRFRHCRADDMISTVE